MEKQELKFTVSDPTESNHTVTLTNGATAKVLELGEILLFKAGSQQELEAVVPQLRELAERTGRFIVFLVQGQELQRIELTQEQEPKIDL